MLLLNNRPIDHFIFPGGEIQVRLPEKIDSERVILTWKPINASEIMFLQLVVNALNHAGITDIDLDVLYLPYARQDRVCQPGQALSLEVICEVLNQLEVKFMRFWDVHNPDVMYEHISDFRMSNISDESIFKRYKILDNFDLDNTIICAPDKGARGKAEDIASLLEVGFAIHFDKVRCAVNGAITGIKPNEHNSDIAGWEVLVVDDICDGGRTFIEVAKELRLTTGENLYLYVTHGIFSKGLDELLEYYTHIYCHHVLHDDKFQSNDRLTILREFPHVP
jgi:ribose-phosphate pyrophosphokinase